MRAPLGKGLAWSLGALELCSDVQVKTPASLYHLEGDSSQNKVAGRKAITSVFVWHDLVNFLVSFGMPSSDPSNVTT
jgi:hypothetical protein